MHPRERLWSIPAPDLSLQRIYRHELAVSPLVAQVLINRGIVDIHEASLFLHGDLRQLRDPCRLPGMRDGVERIQAAIRSGERILVYGDYDVDGVTAAALLVGVLRSLGADVHYYIPGRLEEGYGLNQQALTRLREQGVALVITVDCGIASVEEVVYANSLGLCMIITDHHEPGSELPPAWAVINPKLAPAGECMPLAGVGVAFKLAQALLAAFDSDPVDGILAGDQLDLVALGTVADVVPLTGENRILVKYGLPVLEATARPGLRALIEAAGLTEKKLTPGIVAFGLAPRINAAGRMGDANPAVELLLTTSVQQAWDLAQRFNRENEARQAIETQINKEVRERLEAEVDLERERVLVLASPLWHAGVLGIAASRLVERYYRPAVLIALEGETGKGSARSIPGFDMHEALHCCRDLLMRFGGHQQAAGLSIQADRVPELQNRLNELADKWLAEEQLVPRLEADAEVLLAQIDEQAVTQLELLAPFGYGNPEPVLVYRKGRMMGKRLVGKNANHLKFSVRGEDREFDGIGFNLAALQEVAAAGEPVDLAFALSKNHWQGRDSIQMILRDCRLHVEKSVTADPFAGPGLEAASRALPALAGGTNCLAGVSPPAGLKLLLETAFEYCCRQGIRLLVLAGSGQEARAVSRRAADLLALCGLHVWLGDGNLMEFQVNDLLSQAEQPGLLVATPGFFRKHRERLLGQTGLIVTFLYTANGEEQDALNGELTGCQVLTIGGRKGSLAGAVKVDEPPAGAWRTVDLRGSEDPLQQLTGLVAEPGNTLVWTERERTALWLVSQLRQRLPGGEDIAGWLGEMSWQQKRMVIDQIENDMVRIVVAAGPMDAWLNRGQQRVVFWECPDEPAEMMLRALPGAVMPASTDVYLLGGISAGNDSEEQNNFDTMDRRRLGRLYIMVKQMTAGHLAAFSQEKLEDLYRRCGLDHTGNTGLAVLEELALVRVSSASEGGLRITCPPTPEQKLDLSSSWRFREHDTDTRLTAQYRAALRQPADCDVHQLLKQVFPTTEQ